MRKNEKTTISPLKSQITAFLLALSSLACLWLILSEKDEAMPTGDSPKLFENAHCSLLRPPGWSGGRIGDSFIFRHGGNAVIVLDTVQLSDYVFAPLDKNPEAVSLMLKDLSSKLGLNLSEPVISSVSFKESPAGIPSLRVNFKTLKFSASATIFHSRDVRFIYLALNSKPAKKDIYVERVFLDYLTLKPPLDVHIYKRPVINSRETIDSAILLKVAEYKFREAKALWDNSKQTPANLHYAIRSFQDAMTLTAKSNMGEGFREKLSNYMRIYKACEKSRGEFIEKLKCSILQYTRLGNKTMAKDLAEELMWEATMAHNLKLRLWAKQQYELNGGK